MVPWGSLVAAVAVAIIVSGCSSGGPSSAADGTTDPSVIRDPDDYSYLENGTARGSHVHDYWGEETSLQVVYETFDLFFAPQACPPLPPPWPAQTNRNCFEFTVQPGLFVYPGTRWVNITGNWSHTAATDGLMGLGYRTPLDGPDDDPTWETIGPDETLSIEITEELTDLPHSTTSAWRFWLKIESTPFAGPHSGWVGVNISRPEGPLSVAPPHPDFWSGGQDIVLVDDSGRLFEVLGQGLDDPLDGGGMPPFAVEFGPPGIVPPLSAEISIHFYYNTSSPSALQFNPTLGWHGADRYTWEQENVAPDERDFGPEGGLIRWVLQVEPRMWDSPYAQETAWEMSIRWFGGTPFAGATYHDGDYHLVVTVSSSLSA